MARTSTVVLAIATKAAKHIERARMCEIQARVHRLEAGQLLRQAIDRAFHNRDHTEFLCEVVGITSEEFAKLIGDELEPSARG